jgi:hypothetical protein
MIIEKQGKNNFEISRQFFEIFPFIPSKLGRTWTEPGYIFDFVHS